MCHSRYVHWDPPACFGHLIVGRQGLIIGYCVRINNANTVKLFASGNDPQLLELCSEPLTLANNSIVPTQDIIVYGKRVCRVGSYSTTWVLGLELRLRLSGVQVSAFTH